MGVAEDVEEDLAHLVGVGQDGGQAVGAGLFDDDLLLGQDVPDHLERFVHDLVDRPPLQAELLDPGEVEQFLDEALDLVDALERQVEVGLDRLREGLLLGDLLDVQLDRGQGIADLVGDRGGHAPDGGQLLVLDELPIGLLRLLPGAEELGGHPVEAPGQLADLVLARGQGDGVAEVSLGDADRGLDEAVERPGDAAGQDRRAEDAQDEARRRR
ncbi:MAG: hypothetical protein MZV64_63800 [Ignavibacteriales bacterium]|nr:hypothetical protein [Ignavibacteriales bacterium]